MLTSEALFLGVPGLHLASWSGVLPSSPLAASSVTSASQSSSKQVRTGLDLVFLLARQQKEAIKLTSKIELDEKILLVLMLLVQ